MPGYWYGACLTNFTPAANKAAQKAIHDCRLHIKGGWSVTDLAYMAHPIVRGPMLYCGRFCKPALYPVLCGLNMLVRCVNGSREDHTRYRALVRQGGTTTCAMVHALATRITIGNG